MSEVYRAIIGRVLNDVWQKFDLKAIDELYAPDFTGHVFGVPELRGPEGYKNLVKQFRAPFPDLRVTANKVVVEGDTAALHWTVEGTQKGEMELDGMRLPASEARIHYSGLSLFEFRNGKIAKESIMGDALTQRRQLGVLPDAMAVARLEELARAIIEEFWNKNRIDLAGQFVTPGYVLHGPQGMIYRGIEGLKEHASTLRAAIPDVHFTIEEMACTETTIAMRWSFKGTHQAEFHGIPASGRPIMLFGASMSHVKDGKVTETWGYWDVLDLMHQMGQAQEVKVQMTA